MALLTEKLQSLVAGEALILSSQLADSPKWSTPRAVTFWCPTESVRAAARRAGYPVPKRPACLERTHDKAFLGEIDLPTLPGRVLVETQDEWEKARKNVASLDGLRVRPRTKRLKRRFGFAGRGQRTISPSLSADDERWISDSLEQGGFIVEPEIDAPRLAAIHGMITANLTILGSPLRLESNESLSREGEESDESMVLRILQQGRLASAALLRAGYFGPFGLDVLIGESNVYALDLNPRFTLHFSQGMGQRREEALRLYDEVSY
jgi:hypothetical protein